MNSIEATIISDKKEGRLEYAMLEAFTFFETDTLTTDDINTYVYDELGYSQEIINYVKESDNDSGSKEYNATFHNTMIGSELGWIRTSMKKAGSIKNIKKDHWQLVDATKKVLRLSGSELNEYVTERFKELFVTYSQQEKRILARFTSKIKNDIKQGLDPLSVFEKYLKK